MKTIEKPGCCCGCPCCSAPKGIGNPPDGAWKVTLAGVVDAACGDCGGWNTAWELPLLGTEDNYCSWELREGLPCEATRLLLEIFCPIDLIDQAPVAQPNVYFELGVWEAGNFVGELRGLHLGVTRVDCSDVLLDDWHASAHLPNPDRCDFRNATARITQ